MLNIGLATEIITPPFGAGLAGYFNYRPARGVYDDITVRAMAIEQNGRYTGFLTFDLCYFLAPVLRDVKLALKAAGITFVEDIIISATHTHTGTAFRFDNANEAEAAALKLTSAAAVRAMKRALKSMAPGEFLYAEQNSNPCAYVRRYKMKSGAVVTNPTRCNPDIVGPETDFDKHIRVLAVKQYDRISAVMVNLANHCDTVGGDFVSADWPGRMEAEIQYQLKQDVPVFPLTDASGNINHFDVHHKIDQTNYNEACRIGRIYGRIVVELLKKLEPVSAGKLEISHAAVELPHYKVTKEQYAAAKKYLEDTKNAPVTKGDLTSEGLANGDVTVLRYFAQRMINCAEKSTKSRVCKITRVNFGKNLAFVTLPGEPFNGIAQEIRKKSPYAKTIIVELAQSEGCYVPMHDCFERGGYEVQPDVNTMAPEASDVLIAASVKNL